MATTKTHLFLGSSGGVLEIDGRLLLDGLFRYRLILAGSSALASDELPRQQSPLSQKRRDLGSSLSIQDVLDQRSDGQGLGGRERPGKGQGRDLLTCERTSGLTEHGEVLVVRADGKIEFQELRLC